MAVNLSPVGGAAAQFFTNTGAVLTGGKLFTYLAGTTTPEATYTTSSGDVARTNPIILDSAGRVPSGGEIWITVGVTYKFLLKDSNDVLIGTYDNISSSSNTDASLVSYTPAGTGAVTTTVQAKLRQYVSPQDFGAVGNGSTDDTTALQAMFTAAKYVDLGDSSKNYKITSALTIQTGTVIVGGYATITQTTNNTQIINYTGRSNISISGVKFVGVGTDFLDSDSSLAVAIYGNSGESNIDVFNNIFENFSYTAFRAKNANRIQFCNNIVVGPGAPILEPLDGSCYGALFDSGCSNITASNNTISNAAQGFRIENTIDCAITANNIYDIIGQHGIYAGPNSGLTISDNTIRNTSAVGIKVQSDNAIDDCLNITITGNTIDDAGDQGILLQNGAGATSQAKKLRNVVVDGNAINITASSGINAQNIVNGVISNNTIRNVASRGINLSACDYLTVDSNTIIDVQLSGISDQAAINQVSITNNNLHNVGQISTGSDRYGIFLDAASTTIKIAANTITDANAKMQYGIYTPGVGQTSLEVYDNSVGQATDTGARFKNATDAMIAYRDNYFNGTSGATTNDPALPTVASAASITLSTAQNIFSVTGTTNITAIVPKGHSGHTVTLIFTDVLTVSDNAALLLAGNFITTANDTLTLTSDGIYWYEIARSVN